ncbi:endonuclease/exonuclease/phosphatase family protein [Thalassococcus lentus]|uniref:Endonuclease/exonuclease/phosphatase family protein n=1 Tax=Thalassococcus lentus TaxID=1210524 RepID=A0ABT4XS67_9RHOB|nr:endonuclease/exonuclease/phosphatase family protein [Thalassococcus lentus]MDA7424745.1 endonuclease/exonuclease/phosphatase family protein [Thalassococcus lentus]
MSLIRGVLGAGAWLVAALVLAGYFGQWHPAADSFAVFRVPLAICAMLLFALGARGWQRGLGVAAMVAVLVPHGYSRFIPANGPGDTSGKALTLYQQNLLFSRKEDQAWLEAVTRQMPDVLTLQEVSGCNKTILAALKDQYPTQIYCDFATVGGVAVLSRLPAVPGTARCAGREGAAAVQLMSEGGPIWLVSIHLHWPWPYGQADQVNRLEAFLSGLDGRVILAGDFNAVAWSHTVSRIGQASGTRRVGTYSATFELPVIPLPVGIDHVMASKGFSATVLTQPKLGSDHHGVFAVFDWD